MQTLRTIALLAVCIPNASEAQSDTTATQPAEVIEEIVVKGFNWCGIWPIQHRGLIGCTYIELDGRDLEMALDLRSELFADCLSCRGNQCTANAWPDNKTVERMLCRRLFWTPSNVAKWSHTLGRSGPLSVSVNFAISTAGSVNDIEIVSFDGDIEKEDLLDLIERGARRARFEPVIIEDTAYKIVGLHGSWVLE